MKFEKFLEIVNIKDEEKQALISLRNNIDKPQDYNCKKIRITGNPGVGKTELAKNFLTGVKIPIAYLGLSPEKGYISCKDSFELLETAEKHEKCVIFLDDVQTIIRSHDREYDIDKEDGKNLFKLFHLIEKSKYKVLIIISSTVMLHQKIIDRLDAEINIDVPTKNAKKNFIQTKYHLLLKNRFVDYLATKTIGYTFRDIESTVKMIASSNKEVSFQGIDHALTECIPSALEKYDVTYVTDVSFDKIIGKDDIKEQLKSALVSIKHKELASRLGINSKNLFFFYGEPGTGKTFMAKAIAGELNLPIIRINAESIMKSEGSPLTHLKEVIELGIRFGDSILLFDEAEKIFGKSLMGEDHEIQGDLQGYLDGVGKKLKSLVIFTLNQQARFGAPLKDRFLVFKFDKPDYKERIEFLKKKQELAKTYFSIKADVNEISKLIGNESFREMEKIWDQTLLKKIGLKDKQINLKDFKETIKLMRNEEKNVLCG